VSVEVKYVGVRKLTPTYGLRADPEGSIDSESLGKEHAMAAMPVISAFSSLTTCRNCR
jgi:hypothetical protein